MTLSGQSGHVNRSRGARTVTMSATRAEAVLRTVVRIASDRTLEVAFRLDGSYLVGQPLGLKYACCRPRAPAGAPSPSFRLCWCKICMIRSC